MVTIQRVPRPSFVTIGAPFGISHFPLFLFLRRGANPASRLLRKDIRCLF